MAKNKIHQSTRKQRREHNRRLEAAKRSLAHSTPHFNPRESWTSRKKVGDVPVCILNEKQHQYPDDGHFWRRQSRGWW